MRLEARLFLWKRWVHITTTLTPYDTRDPFYKGCITHNPNLVLLRRENSHHLMSQFYTCHDSRAVVACTKLWHDWIIKSKNRQNLHRISIWTHKLAKWIRDPWVLAFSDGNLPIDDRTFPGNQMAPGAKVIPRYLRNALLRCLTSRKQR